MLAFDARGRGLSDKPESGYTMADHTADLLGALDALRLERVHLVGHSFGGLLTYYVAANHPERVETAVVLDAPADLDLAILDQTNGSIRPRCNPAHIRAVIEGELEIDWPATIERVTCPTLIVRATDPFGPPGSGPILTAESAQRAVARLQDGTLAGFRGNHITFIFGSHARDVVEEIVSFITARNGA